MLDSSNKLRQVLAASVVRLLTPLARVLMRNGMSFNAFYDISKKVFVKVASGDFAIPGRKQTVSRVAILTGLSRKEVQRILAEDGLEASSDAGERYNRAARVIAGWVRDRDYCDAAGEPLPLALDGDGASFAQLVKRYSGDMPSRAILDELLHVGAIEQDGASRVRLLSRAYIPRASDVDKLDILGADVADLIATIDHNLRHADGDLRFQRKVMYDNVPLEAVAAFRELSAGQAQALLEAMDKHLSRQDRDLNPSRKGTGRMRVGIGIYYFEEDLDKRSEEK